VEGDLDSVYNSGTDLTIFKGFFCQKIGLNTTKSWKNSIISLVSKEKRHFFAENRQILPKLSTIDIDWTLFSWQLRLLKYSSILKSLLGSRCGSAAK
jgi:hypothetical protein